jgi:hypothetical protein
LAATMIAAGDLESEPAFTGVAGLKIASSGAIGLVVASDGGWRARKRCIQAAEF